MNALKDTKFMPPAVFKGGNGDLVLCQEWPFMDRGERFIRVVIDMKDAEKLAMQILAVARSARGEGKEGGGGQDTHYQT